MMDWEDMILQRQEEIEQAEDCGGDCVRCPHLRYMEAPYPWQDQIEYCALTDYGRR